MLKIKLVKLIVMLMLAADSCRALPDERGLLVAGSQ